MKYKKYSYIIVLILMLVVGINKTYAASQKECFYISPDGVEPELKVSITIKWGTEATFTNLNSGSQVTVNKFGNTLSTETTPLLNWAYGYVNGSGKRNTGAAAGSDNCPLIGQCFSYFYNSLEELKNLTNPSCPKYVVIEFNTLFGDEYFAYGTNSESLAKGSLNYSGSHFLQGTTTYAYASNFKDGKQITKDMYYNTFVASGIDKIDETTLECEELFTSEIQTMLSDALKYPRIIVPILIIVFGILDFGKAVISSKEDEMKKAQSKFVRRIIAGVAVFFVPLMINIVMDFANIVWEGMGYTQCNFK